jgi:lysophospholipase L1-like esterase
MNNTPQDPEPFPGRMAPDNYPAQLMAGRRFDGLGIPAVNVAISGAGFFELIVDAATRLYPHARNLGPGFADVLILNGGHGDVLDHTATGAQAYSDLEAYIDGARTAGFTHVIATTMPGVGPNVLGTGRPTPAEYDAIEDFRALVMANSAGADEVVDLFVPPLDDATDGTYWYLDRTHPIEAGAVAMADLVAPALDAVLASL